MKQELNFLDPNPGTVALWIQEHILKGWRLDENRPMALWGYMWEVWVIRDPSDEQLADDAAELAKPSRGEILKKAREAKAAKKAAGESEEQKIEEVTEETT